MQGPHIHTSLALANMLDVGKYRHRKIFEDVQYPWDALPKIEQYLRENIAEVAKEERRKGKEIGSVYIDEDVVVGEGTTIEHGAMVKGPAIIGRNCEIRKGAYIRGNALVGDNCIIGNSTELKNCILLDGVQAAHFNYIGDSILGNKAHMAAGAIISNLKLDQKPIVVRIEEVSIPTGLKKLGAIMGDNCEIGCNVVLNPGSILGRGSVVYPGVSFRGYLPANSICKLLQTQQIVEKRQP